MARKPKKKERRVKLLLNETVRYLGKVGDVVEVKPGYARNYLVPYGLAIAPTENNLKKIEDKRKAYEKWEAEQREKQTALLGKLEGQTITLVRRANERGNLYGSVGASDVSHALSEAGLAQHDDVEITADEINLYGKIDEIGDFQCEVRFAEDLKQEIGIKVEADEESKAQIEEYKRESKAREEAAMEAEKAEAAAEAMAPRA